MWMCCPLLANHKGHKPVERESGAGESVCDMGGE